MKFLDIFQYIKKPILVNMFLGILEDMFLADLRCWK